MIMLLGDLEGHALGRPYSGPHAWMILDVLKIPFISPYGYPYVNMCNLPFKDPS